MKFRIIKDLLAEKEIDCNRPVCFKKISAERFLKFVKNINKEIKIKL